MNTPVEYHTTYCLAQESKFKIRSMILIECIQLLHHCKVQRKTVKLNQGKSGVGGGRLYLGFPQTCPFISKSLLLMFPWLKFP